MRGTRVADLQQTGRDVEGREPEGETDLKGLDSPVAHDELTNPAALTLVGGGRVDGELFAVVPRHRAARVRVDGIPVGERRGRTQCAVVGRHAPAVAGAYVVDLAPLAPCKCARSREHHAAEPGVVRPFDEGNGPLHAGSRVRDAYPAVVRR